jgi:rubrerythrin
MKYICSICGYVYDEAKEKSSFSDLPADWTCPLCDAPKSDFAPEEVTAIDVAEGVAVDAVAADSPADSAKPESSPALTVGASAPEADSDLQKLSAGQLAALCSNLAQGCEKQYLHEESALFKQLSDYFASITPAVEDATVLSLAEDLKKEVDGYALLNETAKAAGDRGAQRVCVWGEKVSRILSSLVQRYLKEGETMMEGKEVWVCSACGFVYIGEKAHEICPVCKVPSWKFEKIERR